MASVLAHQANQTTLDLDPVGAEDARLVIGIGRFQRDGIALAAQALQLFAFVSGQGFTLYLLFVKLLPLVQHAGRNSQ